MANAALLKELMEVYSEVTMAKDALKKKAAEIAVAAEEMGLELAKELRVQPREVADGQARPHQVDAGGPAGKQDMPMAELPKELEDMVGELMEQQEDLFDEMEDANANWTDSLDKGAGWDAMDGPIANMSAKGVTGNQLPNNNEMGGRTGEGRSGKSQGELVEETASGKGGRNTPTRLDPTPFQQGQVKDEIQGPGRRRHRRRQALRPGRRGPGRPGRPPSKQQEMQALAAEAGGAAQQGRAAESSISARPLRQLQAAGIDRPDAAGRERPECQPLPERPPPPGHPAGRPGHQPTCCSPAQIHVQHDTSPTMSKKMEDQINDAMKGQLPAAWSEALKEYYRKLSQQ